MICDHHYFPKILVHKSTQSAIAGFKMKKNTAEAIFKVLSSLSKGVKVSKAIGNLTLLIQNNEKYQ